MNQDVIATVLTGIGVLFGVWRLVHAEIEGVRRDLTAQISAVHTRIDNVLLADRKHSRLSTTSRRLTVPSRSYGPEGSLPARNRLLSRSGPGVSPEVPERSGGRRSR